MIVSLGEIESTASLAARGAGYSWGLAEEAGKSARWLAARRIPWLPTFLAMLASAPSEPEFKVEGDLIRAKSSRSVSPLPLGAYIVDSRSSLPVTLRDVRYPIWLLPYVAVRGRERRTPLSIEWNGAILTLTERAVSVGGDTSPLWTDFATQARIDWAHNAGAPLFVKQSGGAPVDRHAWSEIEKLAARTYVPASEASRLRGAGAGVNDTD